MSSNLHDYPPNTSSGPRKKKKGSIGSKIFVIMCALLVIAGLLIATQSTGIINSQNLPWLNKYVQPFSENFNSIVSDAKVSGKEQVKGADGDTVYKDDNDHVGHTKDENSGALLTYAPDPAKEFKNATCTTKSVPHPAPEVNNSWSIPSIGKEASFSVSGHGGEPMIIPDAPQGTMYAEDAQLGDTTGAILQAGHVDYGPGALSPQGGELSPWGYLHRVNPCDHVYEKDDAGNVHEFVITDLYTVPQKQFGETQEFFRKDGPLNLYMVTCSGPSIGDDGASAGNRLLFNYKYNLVVKAQPVS